MVGTSGGPVRGGERGIQSEVPLSGTPNPVRSFTSPSATEAGSVTPSSSRPMALSGECIAVGSTPLKDTGSTELSGLRDLLSGRPAESCANIRSLMKFFAQVIEFPF